MKTKGRFNDDQASLVMRSLVSAVEHVHSKNYVHRDLKPENILINDADDLSSVKLADFGLSAAYRLNAVYSLDERMGTLLFMAPEQTRNYKYGKVNSLINYAEGGHVGLWHYNVHFDRRATSTLQERCGFNPDFP